MRPIRDIGPPANAVCFGPFLFDTQTGELYREESRIKLSGHPIEILRILVERHGEAVTREELRRQLWPDDEYGDFEQNLNAAVNRLRDHLCDSVAHPKYIETIPRHGYRFIAPLDTPQLECEDPPICGDLYAEQVRAEAAEQPDPVPPAPQPCEPGVRPKDKSHNIRSALTWLRSHLRALIVLASILLVIPPPPTPHPSRAYRTVAVLYVNNLTQDPSLDWLRGAITNMLTTNLAQVEGLDVIATDLVIHSLQDAGWNNQALDFTEAKKVAQDLGTDAYITGTLLKMNTAQLRLEVRAHGTKDGHIIFSEKEDMESTEVVLGMIDELTRSLAGRFLPNDLPAEEARIELASTSSIKAYRHYQSGRDYVRRSLEVQALREFNKAISIDPQFASAYLQLAHLYCELKDFKKADAYLDKAEQLHSRLPRSEQLLLDAIRANRGTGQYRSCQWQ